MAALAIAVVVAYLLWRHRTRTPPSPAPILVLLVEDDPAQAYVVAEHVRREGLQVEMAHSLAEAEALLQRERFDLLLLDLLLPEGSTIDLARRVRHRHYQTSPHVPILLLTGLTLQSHELLQVSGANACFFKPLDYRTLHATVETWIRRSRAFN